MPVPEQTRHPDISHKVMFIFMCVTVDEVNFCHAAAFHLRSGASMFAKVPIYSTHSL